MTYYGQYTWHESHWQVSPYANRSMTRSPDVVSDNIVVPSCARCPINDAALPVFDGDGNINCERVLIVQRDPPSLTFNVLERGLCRHALV